MSLDLFTLLDVVVPIHPNDVMHINKVQFQTRVLYNADPPFNVSLVMDAHVLFCNNDDLETAFNLFQASDTDLAYSSRILNQWVTSGFAVMYRRNPTTQKYWREVTRRMNDKFSALDDQYHMNGVTKVMRESGELKFRWLSNNWFFATHGVNQQGIFAGKSNCYRSSVLVNGRIRFIHGGENQCILLNGNNNQYGSRTRTVYIPGTECEGIYTHSKLVSSQSEFDSLVGGYRAPNFDWNLLDNEDPESLFWYDGKCHVC